MEGYLNYLKKEYEKTEATWHLKTSGWDELGRRIGLLETPRRNFWFRNFAVAFAALLIFLAGTYKISQAALPGDVLFPMKVLSEKIIQSVSGSNQIVIDHRAQEIIGLSRKQEINTQDLKEAVSGYAESVDQTKTELRLEGKPSINFQNHLDQQHSEFERISHDHPEIENEIRDARDASSRSDSRGED